MEIVKTQQIMLKDGELFLSGLPYKQGQFVEIIILPTAKLRPRLTIGEFRKLGLIGLWKDRLDIADSSVYARQLREEAQQRRKIEYDFIG